MIYEEPRFLPGGDKFIEMELGDEMSFDCNFLVHSVAALIRQAKIRGIVELVPELSTIMISYDGDRIGQGRENAKTFLKDNPEIAGKIEMAIRQNAGLIAEQILGPIEAGEAEDDGEESDAAEA